MNPTLVLQLARIVGQVVTEVSQLKAAMPQEEAATRGMDELAAAKNQVDQLVNHLEAAAAHPGSEPGPLQSDMDPPKKAKARKS